MAPDVLVPGTVTQDPNQTFAPTDVGNGATAHPIVLTDASFLRITLNTADLTPPNGAIDIDLYLYDAAGEVASSGAGSTNEIIQLEAPAPGTYTLYVHGWQTTGTSVGYNLHTWQVPAAPGGGSLVINAAPPSATQGTVGTVDIGWSGLAVGNYLGAVSHTGDTLLGFTLVEVDNTP